mgnify:FL=1|tara:strand:+ start:7122 stop:8372 length:1251 start_codon:yes stop_codon:yes gene_type:complete
MGNSEALQALAMLSDIAQAGFAASAKTKEIELASQQARDANNLKVLDSVIKYTEGESAKIQNEINQNIKFYEDATNTIYKLNDSEQSNNVLSVLDSLTGNTVTDYTKIAKAKKEQLAGYRSMNEDLKSKIQQVGLIKDFYTGMAHSYEGGIDSELWDVGDFSDKKFKEYINSRPELKGVSQEAFFEGIQAKHKGSMGAIIDELNKRKLAVDLQQEKLRLYTDKGKLSETGQTGRFVENARIKSGYNNFITLSRMANDETLPEDQRTASAQKADEIKVNIEASLSTLMQQKISLDLPFWNDYTEMLQLAKGVKEGDTYIQPDYSAFYNLIDEAYKNYAKLNKKNANQKLIADKIEEVAQDFFGFSGSFDDFATQIKKIQGNDMLGGFTENDQIELSDLDNLNTGVDIDNQLKKLGIK